MESNLFILLSLVIVLAVAMSALMRLLRQPLIVGYILTGVLIGPSFFKLIPAQTSFDAFGSIGIALLLFIIGLGLNTAIIKRLGKVVIVSATAQIILTTIVAFFAAIGVGFSKREALVVGVALTFSSTIIIIKLINDKREQTRLYAQISIGILLVQDIVASVALVFLATATQKGGISAVSLLQLGAKAIAIGLLLALVSSQILPRIAKFVASSQEFLFLFALAWGFGIAALFEILGFSIAVGALFAGISLASLPYSQEIASRLKPLRDFFVVVFFISLGRGIQLDNLNDALLPTLLFCGIVVLIKPLTMIASMGSIGYMKRTSFKTAVTLSQVSEFSLIFVVLAQQTGLVPASVSTILTLVAVVTIAISTYLMKYDEQIFLSIEHLLRFFERKNVNTEHKHAHHHFPMVLFGYHKGGEEFIKSFKAIHKNFVVVDYDPEAIEQLEHRHINYLYGDATDLELLEELGLDKTKLIVSTITDFEVNTNLLRHILKINPQAIVICHSDNYEQAAELYRLGAMYVMLPHLIGSERIGSFIRRAGLHKKEFVHYREKHLMMLESQRQLQ